VERSPFNRSPFLFSWRAPVSDQCGTQVGDPIFLPDGTLCSPPSETFSSPRPFVPYPYLCPLRGKPLFDLPPAVLAAPSCSTGEFQSLNMGFLPGHPFLSFFLVTKVGIRRRIHHVANPVDPNPPPDFFIFLGLPVPHPHLGQTR